MVTSTWFKLVTPSLVTENKLKAEFENLRSKRKPDVRDWYLLSLCYEEGHGTPKNLDEAAKFCQKVQKEETEIVRLAKSGDAVAQYILGEIAPMIYPQSHTQERLNWWHAAADKGNVLAQNALGTLYHDPESSSEIDEYHISRSGFKKVFSYFLNPIPEYYQKKNRTVVGLNLWKSAADKGYFKAQRNLGLYYRGACKTKAVEWLTQAAQQGDAVAQLKLAKILPYNSPDEKKLSIRWTAEAAHAGLIKAQARLANLYEDICKLYKIKLNEDLIKNDPLAQFIQGGKYERENKSDKERLALKCYERSAKQKFAPALNAVIKMYFEQQENLTQNYLKKTYNLKPISDAVLSFVNCIPPPVNKNELKDLYEAAKKGAVDSQLELGKKLLSGTPKEVATGIVWLAEASLGGSGEASFTLANYYLDTEQRENYPSDIKTKEAFEWLLRAESQGYVPAQNELKKEEIPRLLQQAANFYAQGIESLNLVDNASLKKAFSHYEKAATLGSGEAQYRLGCMYYKGEGVQVNVRKGYGFLEVAAQNGSEEAASLLEFSTLGIDMELALQDTNPCRQVQKYCHLGWHKWAGLGCNKDLEDANGFYQKALEKGGLEDLSEAALAGDSISQFHLGRVYLQGIWGTPIDENEAHRWFKSSAKKGYGPAESTLGSMYYDGLGGLQIDREKAAEWYDKSGRIHGWALGDYNSYYLDNTRTVSLTRAAEDGYLDAQMAFVLFGEDAQSEAWLKIAAIDSQEPIAVALYESGYNSQFWIKYLFTRKLDSKPKIADLMRKIDKLLFLQGSREGNNEQIELSLGQERLEFNRQVSVDMTDQDENTALHLAAMHNHASTVRLLLNKGAPPTALNAQNETALIAAIKHYPALFDREAITEILASPQNNLNQRDRKGKTALAWAVVNDQLSVYNTLLQESGEDREISPKKYEAEKLSLFLLAVKYVSQKIARAMMEEEEKQHLGIYTLNSQKENALHICAYDENNDLGQMLIEAGIPIDAKNKKGKIPVQIAVEAKHEELSSRLLCCHLLFLIASTQLPCPQKKTLDFLFAHGGHFNQRDCENRTLVHVAVRCENDSYFWEYLQNLAEENESDLPADEVEALMEMGAFQYDCHGFNDLLSSLRTLLSTEAHKEVLAIASRLYSSTSKKRTQRDRGQSRTVSSSSRNSRSAKRSKK